MSSSTAEISYLPTGCDCDGTSYTQAAIETACQEALTLASQKKTEGKDKCAYIFVTVIGFMDLDGWAVEMTVWLLDRMTAWLFDCLRTGGWGDQQ